MAHAEKLPSGRFRGVAKQGRVKLETKTFDKKSQAIDWARRLELAAVGGLDVKGGKARVNDLMKEWLKLREDNVTEGSYSVDVNVAAKLSPALRVRSIASVTPHDVEKWYIYLRKTHNLGDGSLRRYRESLSAFFAWTVNDKRRADNPVPLSKLPARVDPEEEMHPYSKAELKTVFERCRKHNEHNAKIIYILGWTGVRWGEARALRVRDVVLDGDLPHLRISRSQSEGRKLKSMKGRNSRTVPIADEVLPFIRDLVAGKKPDDLVFTGPREGMLWHKSFLESTHFNEVGMGRRIHDLRHTAACIWLAEGVDLATVKSWLGHASVHTTNIYLHHLGTTADVAALKKLNS